MTKTKSTKRALLLSALSLLMCVSMLIGSTFAWFTDSVTSSGNKIQAGTLKLDLELLEKDGSWTSIKDSSKAIFDYDKWEPGYTEVKVLKVENEGNLALKWMAKFVSVNGLSDLANVIDVYVCPSETELAYPTGRGLEGYVYAGTVAEFVNTIETTTTGNLEAGEVAYLGIALKMQEEAGNEYQGMDLGGAFDIMIMATQLTAEEDSFDDQYDKDASYTAEVGSLKAKLAAAAYGETVEYALTHDAYIDSMIKVPNGVTLVLNGNGHQAIVNTAYPFYVNNANIQMNDLTITGKATYAIFTKGAIWDYNGNNATVNASFNNVTVDLDKADNYPVVFNGIGEITMTDCTITGAGLSAEGNYRNGTHIFAGAEINLTVYGGTIGGVLMNANNVHNSTLTISDGAVIDTLILATDQTKTATLTNNGGTVNKLIQQVDDATKLENALKAGYTAALSKDITMEAHLSSSTMGDINIYGEGHTLTLRGIYSVGGKNVTLSNMTLVDNNPSDYTIYNQGGKVELTNVTYSSSINKAFQLTGGGDVILTNCNITGDVTGTYSASNIWCGDGRNVTVNGGTYGSIFINASNGAGVLSAGKITVNDGTIGKLILETEKNTAGTGYKSAVLVQNGGTITNLVENPQNYDLTGLTKLN